MYQILVKDDYTIYRKGIAEIIKTGIAGSHVTEVSSFNDLAAYAGQKKVDIIVMDMEESTEEYLRLFSMLKTERENTTFIVTTHTTNPDFINEIISAGAFACINKDSSAELLINTIEKSIAEKEN